MREGEGVYTDDEVSYENDPVAKLLGQSRRTTKQRREFAQRERQRMAERVESVAKKLQLDNVEVVADVSRLEGKKQRAKGFYSKAQVRLLSLYRTIQVRSMWSRLYYMKLLLTMV